MKNHLTNMPAHHSVKNTFLIPSQQWRSHGEDDGVGSSQSRAGLGHRVTEQTRWAVENLKNLG